MTSRTASFIYTVTLLAMTSTCYGESVVSLDDDGQPTDEQSWQVLKGAMKLAQRDGSVPVWLLLDMTYIPPYVGTMSPAELEKQDRQVRQTYRRLFRGMLSNGDISHPRSGPVIEGPSCLVRVTPRGLKRLLASGEIRQLRSVTTQ